MTIAEIRAKQAELVAQARARLDEIKDDTTAERAAELESQHDAAMAEHDKLEARAEREERLAKAKEALETGDDRAPRGEDRSQTPGVETRGDSEIYSDAFRAFLQRGREGLSKEERSVLAKTEARAQAVGTGSAGGYLVPQGFMAELVKSLKAWGPMLDPGVGRVLTTDSGNSIPWPTMNDTSNEGALIAENTQVTSTDVVFGTKTLGAYKYTSGVVLVPSELLQDAALDPEPIVRDAMGERIGRIANRHLTVGDGVDKPNGFVNAATALTGVAAAALLTFDDLIELEHAVDPAYRSDPSVRWQFNDNTLKLLRKIKNSEGAYIWQPADVRTGAPAQILEHPYSINQAMANVGATNKSVAFGAFNRYVTRMVKQFAIRRLIERYADYDQVGFIGFMRIDGELLDTAAIKTLQHAAS